MADYTGSTRFVRKMQPKKWKMQPKKLKRNAKQEILKDDVRGYRKRKVNAARISAGKPKLTTIGEKRKQDEQVEKMNSFIRRRNK